MNNVLQFHSQPPAELVPVDLVRLAGQTVDFLRPLAQQKEMRIAWNAPRAAVSILADPSRLQQAFFNLALNAFRAMKAGGVLTITVDRSEAVGGPQLQWPSWTREQAYPRKTGSGYSSPDSAPSVAVRGWAWR